MNRPNMSDERERSEEGTFTEEVTPDDALAVFKGHEPMTAKEVADELGVVRRTAYNKLSKLEEEGEIRKKKVGGRSVVWWKPE